VSGEIVVIGAGVGGLAAAARLAAAGHRVRVFERAATVGGKLGRYERRTGAGTFRFDTGPSLLTLPGVFEDLFAATGGPAGLRPVRLDPIVRHAFPGGAVLDSCTDPEEFAARIAGALGLDAALDWRGLWRRAERVWHASWRHVLRTGASPADLARLAWRGREGPWSARVGRGGAGLLGDLAAVAPGRTLRGLGRAHLRDPRLRMLLDRYATYAGADPRRAPAALVAVPYAELAFGGWYLPGGLGTLADALLSRCLDLGVVVETGTAVTRIEAAGGRVHGVRLAGGARVAADVVVANADALAVHRDLLPAPGRLAGLADRSLAGFVLLLGVRGQPAATAPGPLGAHHTVFFPDDYDAEFDAVFGDPGRGVPARPAPDPAVFVTVADDPAVRPDGHEAWFVLVNAPPHGTGRGAVDWRRPGLADAYADRVLALLAGRGADVRDRLLFRETRTPADLADATGTPGGAIYGTASHGLRALARPANRAPARGLFLVGGSVRPGGGLPMVALSAEIVAAAVGPPR
jgi:phytoene desaturase